jgi:hypothetical protein
VRAISIRPANHPITVFLAGNSTVVDQAEEPWAAWGQMFPRFFQPGDYLFIEFAHNDQKPGPSHVDAFTSYKEYLKRLIGEARRRGANPVLVISTQRRNFDASGKVVNTLGDYPEAMRQTAAEENVPLVDLTRTPSRASTFRGARSPPPRSRRGAEARSGRDGRRSGTGPFHAPVPAHQRRDRTTT